MCSKHDVLYANSSDLRKNTTIISATATISIASIFVFASAVMTFANDTTVPQQPLALSVKLLIPVLARADRRLLCL